MIIRVLTEGQYKVSGGALSELDTLDDTLLDAVEADDESKFTAALHNVVSFVQTNGAKLPDEELVESDLIIPTPDTSLKEARELFTNYPRDLT
ncbi:MAG: hypothetical protein PHX16_06355 [Syntrophaceticus sp.]|jgi:hypothetical protein|nr:hypothetical protein [Syntrophaceticus sp.]MDD3314841.1 hypothetical protein [Syntrophaceticus sp.]MDD4359980.1 hypothetical protein [Syntrophaceticus sp.]MDD4783240.1 hypothetical protein [Syntrophaceticus sp.]HBG22844.1 hypothetical protein [Peptococcaceae bacterium]